MAYINPDIINNLYKDFIGANKLADRLNFFYDGKLHQPSFPPYNIVETNAGKGYQIQLAVAGYDKSEIEISLEDNQLVIKGTKTTSTDLGEYNWIWCGIAARNFERKFMLQEDIKVVSADYKNGILTITMERLIQEKVKPKLIAIA